MRVLGDDVLRLNEALFEFRGQGIEHLVVMDDDSLAEHYGELKRRFEVDSRPGGRRGRVLQQGIRRPVRRRAGDG